MSFFKTEYVDIGSSAKFGAYTDYDQTYLGDVISADDYLSTGLGLDEPEYSMNLEEMIEGAYLPDNYQQQADGEDSNNSSCLPRTLTQGDFMTAVPYDTLSSPACRSTASSGAPGSTKSKSTKMLSKDSDEYKRRRQLNNIAVKKSREKAKAESRMTVQRLGLLSTENERLERRVEQLTKELQFLAQLFTKFDDIPEPVKLEVARSFARLKYER